MSCAWHGDGISDVKYVSCGGGGHIHSNNGAKGGDSVGVIEGTDTDVGSRRAGRADRNSSRVVIEASQKVDIISSVVASQHKISQVKSGQFGGLRSCKGQLKSSVCDTLQASGELHATVEVGHGN